jgi:hypothetical protein
VCRDIYLATAGNITPDLVIDMGRTKKIQGFLQRGDGDKVDDNHLWITQNGGRFAVVLTGVISGQLQALGIEDRTLNRLRIYDRCGGDAGSDKAWQEGDEQEKPQKNFFEMRHEDNRYHRLMVEPVESSEIAALRVPERRDLLELVF